MDAEKKRAFAAPARRRRAVFVKYVFDTYYESSPPGIALKKQCAFIVLKQFARTTGGRLRGLRPIRSARGNVLNYAAFSVARRTNGGADIVALNVRRI